MKSNVARIKSEVSEAEWKARVDLAACYRLADQFGWSYLIYNQISLRVPDQPDHFLMKPHELLYEEVKASNLLKIATSSRPLDWSDDVNPAVFSLHVGIFSARPTVNVILHTHTVTGSAMSAHGKGLLPITQTAMRFFNRLSYHDYEGFADQADEAARIVRDLGNSQAMVLRNHGVLVVAPNVAAAMMRTIQFLEASETQMKLEATGAPMIIPSPEVCENTAKQHEMYDETLSPADWRAYLRKLDRVDTSYRE
jgi:ribulose-5-phosphate 4-epimerase/fuculose-1-phosphate aldolase